MSFLIRSRSLTLSPFEEALFWIVDLKEIREEEVKEAMGFLDEETLGRVNKLVFIEDRQRSIIVHAILRIYLEEFSKKKPEILRGAFGKPYLKDQTLHFNISHKKQYAFLGFHPQRPIGVDIEEFHPPLGLPYEWCAMEALLKAKGTGFTVNPPQLFQLSSDCFVAEGWSVYVYSDKIEGHKLAVCLVD